MTAAPRLRPDDVELRSERYALLRVDPRQQRAVLHRQATWSCGFLFCAREDDGLTLLAPEDQVAELGDLLAGAAREPEPYRVITFRPPMDWTVVGFLHRVTGVLAEHGIPLGAISAFARDHLFVRHDRAEDALAALRAAIGAGRLP